MSDGLGRRLARCALVWAPFTAAFVLCAAKAHSASSGWALIGLCAVGIGLITVAVSIRRTNRSRGAAIAVSVLQIVAPVTAVCWALNLLGLQWAAAVPVGIIASFGFLSAVSLGFGPAKARRASTTAPPPSRSYPHIGAMNGAATGSPVGYDTRWTPPTGQQDWQPAYVREEPNAQNIPYQGPPPTHPPAAF